MKPQSVMGNEYAEALRGIALLYPVDLSDNTEVESAEVLEEEGLDEDDELRLIEAIAKSDAQIARGEVVPAEEALARLHARRRA
jgi:hypothetical protein